MDWLVGGDVHVSTLTLPQVMLRAVAVYVVGLGIVRLGKSRLVGRVSALDILVGFILGSLMSRGITGSVSLSQTAAAAAALVASHWVFTWMGYRWHFVGGLTKGHSIPLVQHGALLTDNMRRSHISLRDLAEAARLRGIEDLEEVASAYKERNGDISIIPKRRSAA